MIVLDLVDLMPDVEAEGDDDPMDGVVGRKEKKWKTGEVKVLRVFEQTKDLGARVVVGSRKVKAASNPADEDAMDEEEFGVSASGVTRAGISLVSVAHDGQWFAVVDLLGRTRVYNLDTLQVSFSFFVYPEGYL